MFLKRIVQIDIRIASEYFIEIVSNRKGWEKQLRSLFVEANTQNLFRIEDVTKNPMMPEFVKI